MKFENGHNKRANNKQEEYVKEHGSCRTLVALNHWSEDVYIRIS